MYVNIPGVSGDNILELTHQINSAIFKANEQINAALAEIEKKTQGYTGTIVTAQGETLIFESGILKSKE